MSNIEKKWKPNVEKAWQSFYDRAKENHLVPMENSEVAVKRRVTPWYVKWSVAALLCAVCIGATVKLWPRISSVEMISIQNLNDNEVLVTTMPDGSLVYLSQGGMLSFPRYFAKDQRQVLLKGEAFFEISYDPKRVFIVETELITIEVLGTSFRVMANGDSRFELTVKRGVVKVKINNEEYEDYVEAGEQVQLMANWLQKRYVGEIDVINAPVDKLFFKDESIGQIIRAVNECAPGAMQLSLDDESLSDRMITVTFNTLNLRNTERIAELLCDVLGLEQTVRDDTIYIGKK